MTLTPGLPDNFGWVEYWDETSRAPVIDLWPLLAIPDGDVWSCPFLFSGDEFNCFRPLAEERGFPADASHHVRSEFEAAGGTSPDRFRVTWVTLDEIHHTDWDELSPGYDDHPYRTGGKPMAGSFWKRTTELRLLSLRARQAIALLRRYCAQEIVF